MTTPGQASADALVERLGVSVDPELLILALTHRSFAYEAGGLPTNERLEFLGDSVLGIVVTMGHMDGGAEVIGHHVAAALVGTFLGILLCYGVLSPILTNVENQMMADTRYMLAIRDGLLSSARGNTPQLSVEFARRAMFGDERPNSQEIQALLERRE